MQLMFRLLPLLLVLQLTSCSTWGSRPPRSIYGNRIPPVVAVMEFDNRSGFSGQWNLGTDMADLLVAELMESQKVRVVERQRIRAVLGEISLQDQPHFREEGKVDTGQLLSARYQIRGVITDFSQVQGGGFWLGLKRLLLRANSYTARVALTLTVVDVQSGEIISSAQASGDARANSAYLDAEYKGVNFGGEAFSRTPLGTATTRAINTAVHEITRELPKKLWEPRIAGTLAKGQVILNGGRDRSMKTRSIYRVLGPVRVVRDPSHGDVLTRLPGPDLGRVVVIDVQDTISICSTLEGENFPRGAFLKFDGRLPDPEDTR
jgi:curli biogenesis system outer membrane secretion channel CsgG